MRLTLRTLLAYLDDVLEPNEAREISKKISQSKEAEALVAQVRESIRRRRIAAPELAGPGSGPDPNIVSEYLENALTPDQVVEYEKLCRNSDLHLAEVASCHKILTMVMGQPIQVSDELRDRIYGLGAAKETSSQPAGSANSAAPKMTSGMGEAKTGEFGDGLPDYLKRGKTTSKIWTTLIVILMAGAWVALVVSDESIWTSRTGTALVDAQSEKSLPDEADVEESPTFDAEVPVKIAANPEGNKKAAASSQKVAQAPDSKVSVNPLPPPDSEEAIAEIPKPNVDSPPVMKDGTKQPQTESAPTTPDKPATNASERIAAVDQQKMTEAPSKTAPARQTPLVIMKQEGINIFLPMETSEWMTTSDGSLRVGDEFATPEPFSGSLSFADDLQLTLLPGTRIRRLPKTENANLRIEMIRGRVLISRPPTSLHPQVLELVAGPWIWLVSFSESESELAAEVVLAQPAGRPIENISLPPDVGAAVTEGSLSIQIGAEPAVKLSSQNGWMQLSKPESWADRTAPIPSWTDLSNQTMTAARKQFAKAFEREFSKNVFQSIAPVISDRRATISEYATKTMALTNRDLEIIPALHSDHEETRTAAIRSLRQWLAQDPQRVELLQDEMDRRLRPEVTEIIIVLLWGFSREDAQTPETAQMLVDLLSNDDLAVRELAHFHIAEISGRNYGYHAQAPLAERKAAINRWSDLVKRNGGLIQAE